MRYRITSEKPGREIGHILKAITRRTVLATGASAIVAGCAPHLPHPAPLPKDLATPFVDSHCHIFNANDIPVQEFVVGTAIREYEVPEPWASLAPIIAWMIQHWVDEEYQLFARGRLSAAVLPTARQEEAEFYRLLREAVPAVAVRAAANEGRNAPLAPELNPEIVSAARDRLGRESFFQGFDGSAVELNLEAAALRYLFNHYGIAEGFSGAQELLQQRGHGGGRIPLGPTFRASDLSALSRSLRTDAKSVATAVGGVLYLAWLVMRSRRHNLEQLDETLGTAGLNNTARLFAPSLVDFDLWYHTETSLSIDKQTQLMAELIKQQTTRMRFVHGYVPFDPLRMALKDPNGDREDGPLAVVDRALKQRGFVGVKVYPPMGFKPWGNSSRPNSTFPEHVVRRFPRIKEYELGERIDAALDKIYRYCLTNNVPILTHCSNSQPSYAGAGENAAPLNWKTLFERNDSGVDFKQLRLNLAHFGSLWCHAKAQKQSADPWSAFQRCKQADAWVKELFALILTDDGDRYPNLYFDFSDLGEIAQSEDEQRILVEYLQTILEGLSAKQRQVLYSRMLYGTDWLFLVTYGANHVNFVSKSDTFIQALTGMSQDVFSANAKRFLDLVRGSPTATRLHDFYAYSESRQKDFNDLILASALV